MAHKGIGIAVSKGVPFAFAWTRDISTNADVGATHNKAMGLDYTHDVTSTDHRDGTSAVFAVSFDEPVHTISIRTIPVGITSGNNTAVQARLHAITPDVGTAVILSGGPAYFTADTSITGAATGSWIYKGGASISYTPDGVTEISMTLYRHGFDVESPTEFAVVQDL